MGTIINNSKRFGKNIFFGIVWLLIVTAVNAILVVVVPDRGIIVTIVCCAILGYPSYVGTRYILKKIGKYS